jgi:hypothetical protein
MRRSIWLGFVGIVALTSLVIVFAASVYLRIKPLPSAELIRNAERRRHAERLRDIPSLENLPAIEPMKIERALILEQIGKLVPGKPEGSKPWRPPDKASQFAPEMDFRVEYVAENNDKPAGSKEILVIVEVQQFPNEAWPLYFAKWSPNPSLLQEDNPRFVLTRVEKFNNRIVMNREFRFPDEAGKLWFFWPSRTSLVSVTCSSKVMDEEFLRRYLEKYPSSL